MMTFVHASDEPIDVIREIGILFDRLERDRLYAEIAERLFGDDTAGVLQCAEALYAAHPEHPLDLAQSLDAIERAIAAQLAERPETAAIVERIRRRLRRAECGEALSWRELDADLGALGDPVARWDALVVGSHFVQHDVENEVCTIDDDGRPEWLRGEGTMRDLVSRAWEQDA
jgi:hypothetical protein